MTEPFVTELMLPWPTGAPYTDEEAQTVVGTSCPVTLDGAPQVGTMFILEARREMRGATQLLAVRARFEGAAAEMMQALSAGEAMANLSAVVKHDG